MAPAPVTVVVVPRERFSSARRCLEALYRRTDRPFDLIYVDGGSPEPMRRYLQQSSEARGFRLIRRDGFLSPNQARNLGLQHVDPSSKYVVFIDNDAEAEPGWLDELVACAEKTGAWAVSPVYFEGLPRDRVVHMAGGHLELTEAHGQRAIHESHLHHQKRFEEVRPSLQTGPTGFFEFHCVLLPLSVLRRLGPFDEQLLSSEEHLDFSLLIREAGGSIYLAPDAQVTYVHGLLDKYDLEFASLRWSDDWNRRSLDHFVEKWRLDGASTWREMSVNWGRNHREHLIRMRRSGRTILKRFAATSPLTRRAYGMLREALR